MPARVVPYTDEEDSMIRALYVEGKTTACIVDSLNQLACNEKRRRTRTSVNKQYTRLGLSHRSNCHANIKAAHAAHILRLDQTYVAQHGDANFVRAMLVARASGTERPILGIVKDRRPFVGTFIRPEPMLSICGSPAAECAEDAHLETV